MSGRLTDLEKVLVAVAKIPTPWKKWPGGYPNRLDLALVDAVMSIRFRYGKPQPGGTWSGARGAVLRYQRHSEHVTAGRKMHFLAEQDPVALETVLNRQKVRAGKTKASAIVECANHFAAVGVTHPEDLDPTCSEHRAIYVGVSGLGPVTWEYFTMLAQHQGVKADSWITEFVTRAVGAYVSPAYAGELLKATATILGVELRDLDYAVWSYASGTKLKGMRKSADLPEDSA